MASNNPKISFPNHLGAKRRRMRSGGNVSTQTNNTPKKHQQANIDLDEEKTTETSRCKGTTTIPIFLKKTYKMIDTCDPSVASWTPDGEMFVVKDPELFASSIIPQYFDHNKFSSFARQLNFYGFRKMQSKPIRNADFDADTAKHVTFYNEKFKRGRCDLLKEIQRSTRGGGSHTTQDHQREVEALKKQISTLENDMMEVKTQMEDRMRRLELDMLGRMEQMMVAIQQSQQLQLQQQQQQQQQQQRPQQPVPNGNGGRGVSTNSISTQMTDGTMTGQAWEPLPLDSAKPTNGSQGFGGNGVALVSTDSEAMPDVAGATNGTINGTTNNGSNNNTNGVAAPATTNTNGNTNGGGPTLPPHPKQKQLPPQGLPGALNVPPSRLNSLRGFSRGMSRGVSGESSASAILLRNSWEDKFFSMLMLGENEQSAAAAADSATGTNSMAAAVAAGMGGMGGPPDHSQGPIADTVLEAAIANGGLAGMGKQGTPHPGQPNQPNDQPVFPGPGQGRHLSPQNSERTLSSVSTTEGM